MGLIQVNVYINGILTIKLRSGVAVRNNIQKALYC